MLLPDRATILATPASLKLDFMCRGLRVEGDTAATAPRRMRAGLGSGLELVLPDGVRLNAPVVETFAARSPYVLRARGDGHEIAREDGPDLPGTPVAVAPPPAFAGRKTSSGKPMGRVATLQGTEKADDEIVETALAARREGVTFIHHMSFCVEAGNPEHFARVCPGKAATIGHEAYFDAIEHCARRFRSGAVSGEIIAGIEPAADTLAAIDRITRAGAFPTVCVFRPLAGTAMADASPPAFEAMYPVFRHLYRRVVDRGIPVGLAPNIHVSIIVTPAEARAFAEPGGFSPRWHAYHATLAGKRVLGNLHYRYRSRGVPPRTLDA